VEDYLIRNYGEAKKSSKNQIIVGSFGLAAFGLVIWLMIGQSATWALVLAATSWFTVAVFAWQVRRWF
jgi:hypothetical protein